MTTRLPGTVADRRDFHHVTRPRLIALGIACLIASAAMTGWFDAGVAHWLEHRVPLRLDLIAWQRGIDLVFLKRVSAVGGAALFAWGYWGWRSGWLATRFAMGWGALIAASEYSVDLIKWIAGRERPVHWLAQGDAASDWLMTGDRSFPSGHAAYYWALGLGVAIRWPRFALPALALAIYVTEQRVLVLAHHWGDVIASIGIAMLWAAALLPWLAPPGRGVRRRIVIRAAPLGPSPFRQRSWRLCEKSVENDAAKDFYACTGMRRGHGMARRSAKQARDE